MQSAYVANQNGNSVSVINTVTNTVAATIPVGSLPRIVTVSPDGTRAYVTSLRGPLSVIYLGEGASRT
jgi:YVTN family beta-propeller protein